MRLIVILLMVLILGADNARSFWGYEEMGKRAGSFEKKDTKVGEMIFDNSKFDPEQDNVPRVFGFVTTLTDEQVSQIVGSMDLKYVNDVYVTFSAENEIQVWLKWQRVPQAFLANVRFKYDLNAGVDVEIGSVKMGIFSVPGKWLVGADKPIEEAIDRILHGLKQKNSLEVLEVWTEDGKIFLRTRVTNLDWLVKT